MSLGRTTSRTSFTEILQGFGYLQDALIALGSIVFLIQLLALGTGRQTYAHLLSLPFAFLIASFVGSDLFRQRYYLQRQTETGIHWRAGLLRYAKWPFTIKALLLVVQNKPFCYVVTPKTRTIGSRRMLLIPHGTIAAIVGVAWIVGMQAASIHGNSLQITAAIVVAGSVGLILSERD